MKKVRYTTWGPVCDCCDHEHRSVRTALACLARHREGCRMQGGYSDRHIRVIRPGEVHQGDWYVTRGPGVPLDEWEEENEVR